MLKHLKPSFRKGNTGTVSLPPAPRNTEALLRQRSLEVWLERTLATTRHQRHEIREQPSKVYFDNLQFLQLLPGRPKALPSPPGGW